MTDEDINVMILAKLSRGDMDRLLGFRYDRLKPDHEVVFFPITSNDYDTFYNSMAEGVRRNVPTLQLTGGMIRI